MTVLQDVTEETLAEIAKAQTTGLLESTGAYSYDLTGIVRLIPVVTPFRDKVARKSSPNGSPFAIWRAFMNATASQATPFAGWDYAGAELVNSEQDFQAPYVPLARAGIVTQDAYDVARGLFDPYAEQTMQVLNDFLIAEDRALFGGQSYALVQPAAITAAQPTTGGTVAASTTNRIAVAPRTAMGYYYGGQGRARATADLTTTGATSVITGSIPAVKGAVAYDWYYSSNSGATYWYYTTTTVASVTVTSTIAANQAIPALADLYAISPVASTGVWSATTPNLAADNGSGVASGQFQQFNGFLSSLTGDYNAAGQFVTSGSGTANPAIFQDGAGAALTLTGGSVTQIKNLLLSIWNQVKCSPTALMINGAQAQEIADLILASPSSVTYLNTDEGGRIDTVAGGRVGHVVNTAANVTVPLEVHTSVPPGTIVARTDRVPFPQANIASVLECRTLRDVTQFDYGTGRVANTVGGGPRKEFEVRSVEAFINRAPVAMGLIANIA